MLVPERLLQRVQLAVVGQALDRAQLLPSAWTANIVHALDRLAVDQDGARAALAGVAADVGAR